MKQWKIQGNSRKIKENDENSLKFIKIQGTFMFQGKFHAKSKVFKLKIELLR